MNLFKLIKNNKEYLDRLRYSSTSDLKQKEEIKNGSIKRSSSKVGKSTST